MSWKKDTADGTRPNSPIDAESDPVLERALHDFRANAHAWSQAAYGQPRAQVHVARSGWRPAAAWALGCALAAGSLSGAFYAHHQRAAMAARLALRERTAQQQQLTAQQQRAADEDLLATVDSDISREVPAAMEPLAQLMDEDAAR